MSRDNIVETFTDLAHRYEKVVDSELSRLWGWRYADFINNLVEFTPIRDNDIVLDVATGTGLIPRRIHELERNGEPIHGLDITPAMVRKAKQIIAEKGLPDRFFFTCASALAMPYPDEVFNVVTCGLASHHMDVHILLSEIVRVLRDQGELSIADVGGYPIWKIPGIKFVLKIAAFIYFSLQENVGRAWAEAQGVTNIRSVEEWHDLLLELGFDQIEITRLRSKFFWIPQPLLIRATKNHGGALYGIDQ